MDDLEYEHECVWPMAWAASALAIAAMMLLAIDIADQGGWSPVKDESGSQTFATISTAGAVIRPSEPAEFSIEIQNRTVSKPVSGGDDGDCVARHG